MKVLKFKALGSNVVLKKYEDKAATEMLNGIYVPEVAKKPSQEYIVVGLGTDPEITLKVEDKVIVRSGAGVELQIDNEIYMLVEYRDIMGVFTD